MEEKEKDKIFGKLIGQNVTNVWLDRSKETNEIVNTMIVFQQHTLNVGVRNGKLIIILQDIME